MFQLTFALAVAAAVSSASLAAPATKPPAAPMAKSVEAPPVATGPEYLGVFEARVGDTPLLALERQHPQTITKVKAFGYAGAESYFLITGARSPVRFAVGQPITFIVRASQAVDPASSISFVRLSTIKGGRKLVLATAGPLGINGRDTANAGAVVFNAKKYGQDFFIVTPADPLQPGEYLLCAPGTEEVFLFGID